MCVSLSLLSFFLSLYLSACLCIFVYFVELLLLLLFTPFASIHTISFEIIAAAVVAVVVVGLFSYAA